MSIVLSAFSPNLVVLSLSNSFTYDDSKHYREKLLQITEQKPSQLEISLEQLHFMDSSGLGMLLYTEKTCASLNIGLRLMHPQGKVRDLLRLAHIDDRITIIEQ
ncbi:MAG: anti-sigma factor antagonist [Alphaproteobacteria bacterium]|nr:MAG: anti-sigma factor antagonist [Alphaproteobacteria bacterium]TAF40816.1 MAG: anti-sigma factor antagonist [Alphaproteobacteria bacterium]TAF77004.1 MAG: anti-sigma factor antagonist [Alphaproteobacteria bacterium]